MTSITYFYIPLLVALIGVAYPIILQVIARLDDKYESENVIKLFDQEYVLKSFKWLLWISLPFAVIWSFQCSPIASLDKNIWLIDNSASILLSSSSLLLAIFFLLLVKRIEVYYNPSKLIVYFIGEHSKREKHSEGDYPYFTALSDILTLSIKNGWEQHYRSLTGFFKETFRHQREKQANKPVEYPEEFYAAGLRIMEEVVRKQPRIDPHLYEDLSSINWMLGIGTQTLMIHEDLQRLEDVEWKIERAHIHLQTYIWIWKNLQLLTEYKRDDILKNYWAKISRYFMRTFKSWRPDPSEKDDLTKTHIDEILFEEERDEFRLINLGLGGLLIYQEMYDLLRWIIKEDSQKYDLATRILPADMNEIFEWVIRALDHDPKIRQAAFRYPLSYDNSIFTTDFFKNHILKFLALLYFKHYTSTFFPLELPQYKEEIKKWQENLPDFIASVRTLLFDSELLKKFGLDDALMIRNDG